MPEIGEAWVAPEETDLSDRTQNLQDGHLPPLSNNFYLHRFSLRKNQQPSQKKTR